MIKIETNDGNIYNFKQLPIAKDIIKFGETKDNNVFDKYKDGSEIKAELNDLFKTYLNYEDNLKILLFNKTNIKYGGLYL